MNDFPTPLSDEFVHGLKVDEFRNVLYEKSIPGKGFHKITLQTQSRPRRGGVDVLEEIKIKSAELKEKIIDNLKFNIQDQMQNDTIVQYASCFDLTLPLAKEDRFDLARNCSEFTAQNIVMKLLMMEGIWKNLLLHFLLPGTFPSSTILN